MAMKKVPFRSEVLAWDPDSLADYFKKLNYKDCEKTVKKFHIDGARFLNLTENDIQKFPKLRVPILIRLSQDINKNEERRSIFPRKPQVQRFPEETESHEEDDGGWSSFEDDYESPTEDQGGEDDGDYESPTEEEAPPVEDDADYEPPPSNDEEALQNSILPAKPFPDSMYIDRPHTGKGAQQPPVPPQRTMAALPPPPGARNHGPLPPAQPSPQDPGRSRNHRTPKLPAPSIDRSTKPALDWSLAPADREPFLPGMKPAFPNKPPTQEGRSHGEFLPKIQKPPLPAAPERHDSSRPPLATRPPVPRHAWGPGRRENDEDDALQRPLPQPAAAPKTASPFPSRYTKAASNLSLPAVHTPAALSESHFQHSNSLPPYFSQGPGGRPPPRVESRPVPSKPRPPAPGEENSLNQEWYVSYITRPEAEAALRKINQDGTFLVRDSSNKTISNPYVLMVLYKGKVYNIKIRYQEENQVYLLGTGLRGKEDFLSVSAIIDYFRKMPLLLIDGQNRDSRNQCTLTYSAGHP
ncbi:lymphocyte cytosolic protein 2 [Sorex araneus]|uniref:lymphocyte cytosolic protein 2 n=1 Tax=Sorex araneus TaxID=42254 RepID=UPI0003317437|nr:lymphocyte cytosolic protein 2 [Sorex araneus]